MKIYKLNLGKKLALKRANSTDCRRCDNEFQIEQIIVCTSTKSRYHAECAIAASILDKRNIPHKFRKDIDDSMIERMKSVLIHA